MSITIFKLAGLILYLQPGFFITGSGLNNLACYLVNFFLIINNTMKEKEGSVNFVLGVLGFVLILIVAILLIP